MMKLWQTTLAVLFLATSLVRAQNESFYTVQVGTFIDAKPEDFSALRELGFVHAQDLGSNLMEVYVGGFESRPPAEQLAASVRQNGYANAFVQERAIDPNAPAAIVQMATRQINRPIEWESLMKAGPLYGILQGNLIKIVTGPFTSEAAAQAVLPGIQELGYKDAFVKNVPSGYLLPLTEFETGTKKPLIPLSMNENPGSAAPPQSYDQTKGERLPNNSNSTQPIPHLPMPMKCFRLVSPPYRPLLPLCLTCLPATITTQGMSPRQQEQHPPPRFQPLMAA